MNNNNLKSCLILSIGVLLISTCEEPTEPDTTPPEVTILDPAEGEEISDVFTVKIDATDDNEIEKVVLYIDFVPLDSSLSEKDIYSFGWDTDIGDNGEYTLLAQAFDKSGNKSSSNPVNVTVINHRILKFVNTTWDDIDFEIAGVSDVLLSLDSIEVEIPKNNGITNFYGYSWTGCGISIAWDFDIEVGDEDLRWTVWVNPGAFYLFLSNQSSVDINYVVVNKDLTDLESWCYWDVPNDGLVHKMGYYWADVNSNVYAYLENHPTYSYTYWDSLDLTWDTNQFALLVASGFSQFSTELSPPHNTRLQQSLLLVEGGYSQDFVPITHLPTKSIIVKDLK